MYVKKRVGALSDPSEALPCILEGAVGVASHPPAAEQVLGEEQGYAEQASGDTRFDILIDGAAVETDFSPADGSRYRTAFKRRYIVDNDKDHIVISLWPVKGKPAIAALKVRKL